MNSPQAQPPSEKALIMIVDDNPEFLEGIELTLDMEGYQVWTAPNGQQALDELERAIIMGQSTGTERLPHLILADIMMPGLDGYGLYDQVQANPFLNRIPFVFLSAKTGVEDIRQGKALGVDDYLTKPCTPEDLLATVQGKLNRVQKVQSLNDQLMGEIGPENPSNMMIAVIIVGVCISVAFCLGILFATNVL